MPALPAWPPKSLPRLFVAAALADGAAVELESAQANYLGNVLRLTVGGEVLLFDGASGEWLATIAEAGRKRMQLRIERRTKPVEAVPDLWLAFAPVKRAAVDWLVEKATELGVARLLPVVTARTVVERVKGERLRAIAIEAAEQCGRTLLPAIEEPVSLAKLLAEREAGRTLYFADETGGETIRAADEVRAISLGPRILRAETAALAAVSSWMALAGDWRSL
jgi:16S rRNA (uracil1498-N3)-methyltransferase